jgi:hypothetical protein
VEFAISFRRYKMRAMNETFYDGKTLECCSIMCLSCGFFWSI